MDLYNYETAAASHERELIDSLDASSIAFLKAYWTAKEPQDWRLEFFSKLPDIQKYVQATPAQRLKKKSWNKTMEDKALLTFLAIQYVHAGYLLLKNIDDSFPNLNHNEVSYRNMTCIAGSSLLGILHPNLNPDRRMMYYPLGYWPFDS